MRTAAIKFRYGPSRDQHQTNQSSGQQQTATGGKSVSNEPIYDFQIPQRWRRRPLSEEEIAVINNGGPL